MSLLFPAAGTLLLVLVITDVVWCTLSASRGGPISRRLGHAGWVLTGRSPWAGPLILVATTGVWVGLFWAGWTLVFLGAPEAVVSSSTGAPVGFWDRVYFAGYSVIILGLGDYVPGAPPWRMLTVVCAATGLVFITLAVTYYTAVLSAVVHKQQLAALVRALGDRPSDVVAGTWDGEGFEGLGSVLTTLANEVARLARQHYAYPVLHHFRARDAGDAFSVQAARLGDALILWGEAAAEGHCPPPGPLRAAQGALLGFLRTLQDNFVDPAEAPPPPPDLAPLRAAGIPLIDDPDGAFASSAARDQRRLLLGLVHDARFA